jgi:hypothetical protein
MVARTMSWYRSTRNAMQRANVQIAAALSVLLSIGCDSELRECAPSDVAGARVDACLKSTFKIDQARYLEASGVVRRGESGVPGAVLRIEPFGSGATIGANAVTNRAGEYGPIPFVPFRYDVMARVDRDVIAVHDLAFRYFEPTIETDAPSFTSAWSLPVRINLKQPLAEGRALTFFVSGDATYAVSGSVSAGLTIASKDFSAPFTLHAIEHAASGDLATATAYGRVEGRGAADAPAFVTLDLVPLDPKSFADVVLSPIAPAGFSPSEIDVIVAYSGTSYSRLTTLAPGVSKRVPFLPSVFYIAYRATGRSPDGATVVTNVVPFDPFAKDVRVELPSSRHVVVSPAPNALVSPSDPLVVNGTDILEHVLDGEGRTIRLLGRGGDPMQLPNFEALGATAPKGDYTWRVRSYPKAAFIENLSGPDARRFQPVATSAPRRIQFQ